MAQERFDLTDKDFAPSLQACGTIENNNIEVEATFTTTMDGDGYPVTDEVEFTVESISDGCTEEAAQKITQAWLDANREMIVWQVVG